MFRRKREERKWREQDQAIRERWEYFHGLPDPLEACEPEPPVPATEPSAAEPVPVVDDFLPPDLIAPSQRTAGMMMPWPGPLVADGEVLTCRQCGTYRDWIVLSQHGTVWVRCRAGHETHETRLDAAWFNRHSGPMQHHHASYEDGIRFLGH
ncbi:hypothetical protein ACFRI7_32270 [Streptomyces sp. NPDC056716]|uniref:hypothetical protein n=1 Tax=unclassified Streptomyces TaxID=2593676 RepID=UPI0036C1BD01